MMPRWPEKNWRILSVPLNFVNVGMPQWFYDLECISRLWTVTQIWYMSLSFEIIMMPRWLERNWRILFVPLNFVNVGMLRWFYDLECNSRLWIVTQIWYMSLSFEIIMMPRWPEKNWRILSVPLNFVNVGMPRWFYDLECISRLWTVTQIWYMSLSFEIIMMPRWPERNWRILFVPLNFVNVGMLRWFYDLECNSRLWIVTQIW